MRQVGGFTGSCTNKTNRHDITEILLKVTLSIQTLTITLSFTVSFNYCLTIDSRNTRIIYFVQYYYYLSNVIVYLMSHALFWYNNVIVLED